MRIWGTYFNLRRERVKVVVFKEIFTRVSVQQSSSSKENLCEENIHLLKFNPVDVARPILTAKVRAGGTIARRSEDLLCN